MFKVRSKGAVKGVANKIKFMILKNGGKKCLSYTMENHSALLIKGSVQKA